MITGDRAIIQTTSAGRSPLLAATLSAFLPGAGQLYQGRWRRGSVMLGLTLALGLAALGLWQLDPLQVLAWLVRTEVLLVLLVADLAVLAFRLFAILDAYRGRRGRRIAQIVALAVLLLAVVAPHAMLGYYDLLTLDAIVEVFPADDESSPQPQDGPRAQMKTTLPVVLKPTPTPSGPAGHLPLPGGVAPIGP